MIVENKLKPNQETKSLSLAKLMNSLSACFEQYETEAIVENKDDEVRESETDIDTDADTDADPYPDPRCADLEATQLQTEMEAVRSGLMQEIEGLEEMINGWREKYNETSNRLKDIENILELERKEKQQALQILKEARESGVVDATDEETSLIEEVMLIQSFISLLQSRSSNEEQLRKEMKIQHEQTVAQLERQKDILQQKLEEGMAAKQVAEQEVEKAVALCEEAIRTAEQEKNDKKLKVQKAKSIRDAAVKEKDAAVALCQDAIEKKDAAEAHLREMQQVIKDAKIIDKTNESLHIMLKEQMKERIELHNKIEDLKGRIQVNVRIRPLSQREIDKSYLPALTKADNRTCQLHDPSQFRGQTKSWEFDKIYSGQKNEGNSQEHIFEDTRRLVQSAIDGYNVSVFAYGQTGGGKTYTMGLESEEATINDFSSNFEFHEDIGMAPRVAAEIFRLLESRKSAFDTVVTINMFELYNHYLRDLLNESDVDSKEKYNSNLQIKLSEHSKSGLVEVEGATSVVVNNPEELMRLINVGTQRRATSSTIFNADSSRSHLIFSILIKQVNKRTKDVVCGKFSLVDLAGSERVRRSRVKGTQLKEAQSINKSLSALGDVIHALTSAVKHVPFRNHPLTMLMSDSLGGNSKTIMFVCCSPADFNKGETTSALDFAQRCKLVKNKAKASSAAEQLAQDRLQAQLQNIKTSAPNMSNLSTLNEIKNQSVQAVMEKGS